MIPIFKNFLFATAPLVLAVGLLLPVHAAARPSSQPEKNEWLEVKIYRLAVDPLGSQPVVLLSDPLEERVMPIWIGPFEANALNGEMTGIHHPRPQTHDLMQAIMQEAKIRILRIAITHMQGSIYYASIVIEGKDSVLEVDSRPSDALVMALKFKAPIFISKSLFVEKAFPLGEKEEEEKILGPEAQGQRI